MNYFSTRDKSLKFSFKDIFLRGLAPDGGLFLPEKLKIYNSDELDKLSGMSYNSLATEIIYNFCSDHFKKDQLSELIKKSYKNFEVDDVVHLNKLSRNNNNNVLELFHGPTLAFKDIAMQVIGNMYDELEVAKNKKVNVVVATSGDTGSAAISALNDRKNINVFVLHPNNKISKNQRKIMTTIGSNNIYNIAIDGSFDDCQNMVKSMFNDNEFREKINMSGVNSINWARIMCQIVYYFYAALRLKRTKFAPIEKPRSKINFSVPTGNFGDVYAGYIAKKMGLNIGTLIVATNENDILKRVIDTGEYKPEKVKTSVTPSMDIQVASNFERLLFDLVKEDDKKVSAYMAQLSKEGSFKLNIEELKILKENFIAEAISGEGALLYLKFSHEKCRYIYDPHTATAAAALIKQPNTIYPNSVILATAHPYKFLETVEPNLFHKESIPVPKQFSNIMDKKEKFDIIGNTITEVKNYILGKIQ